jgi:hypothetical protein
VTFTAIAGGGSGLQYRFVTYNSNSGWAIAQEYSAANTFTYSPRAGTNAVQAWVKSSASSAAYDTYATSGYFTVTAAPISVTSFTAGVSFPVALNKLVTFAAQATGSGTLEYSFVTYNEKRGWTVAQAYGPLQTFGYYPGAGKNAVQVWVRRVGSTASYETWASSGYFDVVAFPPPVITSFTANVAFPTRVNTLVAFTAQASGGSGNLEYRFVTYHPNTGWVIAQDYGPLRTFGYYPAVGQNVVQVWVRNAGSTVSYEAWQTSGYFTVAP